MFTDAYAANSNRSLIESFIRNNLPFFENTTHHLHNQDEFILIQVFEVIRQKYEDRKSSRAIIEFINNDPEFLNDIVSHEKVQEFLREIQQKYKFSENEADGAALINATEKLLDTCGRVILITHSQGNFYGNMVLNQIYSDYRFPNGYSIHEYPMLGNMQIASPVDIPGGAISRIHPQIIGHITNKNDLIMSLVRNTIGSVAANYNSGAIKGDLSGHGLDLSYIEADGQGTFIAHELDRIATGFIPYPMHKQESILSSAMNGFGYSLLNSILDIQFTDNSAYRYQEVSPALVEAFVGSESKGVFFNTRIRNNYMYEKIE